MELEKSFPFCKSSNWKRRGATCLKSEEANKSPFWTLAESYNIYIYAECQPLKYLRDKIT